MSNRFSETYYGLRDWHNHPERYQANGPFSDGIAMIAAAVRTLAHPGHDTTYISPQLARHAMARRYSATYERVLPGAEKAVDVVKGAAAIAFVMGSIALPGFLDK